MKSLFLIILRKVWLLRCSIAFYIFGSYGVSNILKNAPFPFIKPILRKYGASIGERTAIDTGIMIHRPDPIKPFRNLVIGSDCYIGHDLLIDLTAKVEIQHDVGLGARCQIWTHVGDYTDKLTNANDYHERVLPLVIGNNTVCYSGVIISPGCSIGSNSRVGAGSVVTRSVEPHTLTAGIPARKIKDLI
jgi:acetyltransferase-like isoleucine patch superfamily enzyme